MGTYNMTAGHLAPAGGGFEPQRVFNWVLVLPGVKDPELIRLACEKVQLPRLSTAVMMLRYMNENVKVSGGASVDSNTITVRDFVDRQVLATLNDWMEQVHDPISGDIGYASDYKLQGTIQLLDPKGNVMRQATALGMWPSSMSCSDLDYNADTGEVKVTLVLQVDKWKLEF
jgi:hypothetical protein